MNGRSQIKEVIKEQPTSRNLSATATRVLQYTRSQSWTKELKDTNPLMSSLLVIFVWGGKAIL
jgi:hypothetical protein